MNGDGRLSRRGWRLTRCVNKASRMLRFRAPPRLTWLQGDSGGSVGWNPESGSGACGAHVAGTCIRVRPSVMVPGRCPCRAGAGRDAGAAGRRRPHTLPCAEPPRPRPRALTVVLALLIGARRIAPWTCGHRSSMPRRSLMPSWRRATGSRSVRRTIAGASSRTAIISLTSATTISGEREKPMRARGPPRGLRGSAHRGGRGLNAPKEELRDRRGMGDTRPTTKVGGRGDPWRRRSDST